MKTCPFLNKDCIKEECQIWDYLRKNCSITAIATELREQSMNEASKNRPSL